MVSKKTKNKSKTIKNISLGITGLGAVSLAALYYKLSRSKQLEQMIDTHKIQILEDLNTILYFASKIPIDSLTDEHYILYHQLINGESIDPKKLLELPCSTIKDIKKSMRNHCDIKVGPGKTASCFDKLLEDNWKSIEIIEKYIEKYNCD